MFKFLNFVVLKVNSVIDKKKKLCAKKKVKGVKNVAEPLQQPFCSDSPKPQTL